jgi:hypothetical protein
MALLQPVAVPPANLPRWIAATLRISTADPLGMQTITQDRILPRLVPGVLALSRRARYLSVFCFLLHQYHIRRLPRETTALGHYVRTGRTGCPPRVARPALRRGYARWCLIRACAGVRIEDEGRRLS